MKIALVFILRGVESIKNEKEVKSHMFYLGLAIICSATIALIFKYTESSNGNRYVVTSANYFIAFFTSLGMMIMDKTLSGLNQRAPFLEEFSAVFSGEALRFSPYGSVVWAMIVGTIFGGFFFLSFVYYQKSVRINGVGISGTFSKLGILIPMLFSIIIWKEYPTLLQWLGILLALVSIIMVNLSFKGIKKIDIEPTIIMLFLFGGLAEFSNKIYQKYALSEFKSVFLFFIFFVAFIISVIYAWKKKSKVTRKDIFIGFAVGIPNLFSSFFLILSLDTLTTSVAFPLFSAGSILLITLGGYIIFKEKISKKNQWAIGLILVALVLLNI